MIKWYKNYTGYAREGFTYLSYPFRPKMKPTNKFVIFTVGRSGSGLLVNLLQSHRHIHCDDELFKKKLFLPLGYLKAREHLSGNDTYGFKLNTYQFRVQKISNPVAFVGEIHRRGYKIISLKRRNLLRQIISHMFALHRSVFHQPDNGKGFTARPFVVNQADLQQELVLFEGYRALRDQILAEFAHLKLSYEDDLSDAAQHQATVDKISEYVGVPTSVVQTGLAKTTPKDLSSLIANFDEVIAYLKGTKYAEFVEMD